MKRFKRILVATDTRLSAHPILDAATELARNNHASMKIVDVVPDFPWTVRRSLADHDHIRELMAEEKAERLEALAEPLRSQDLDVRTRVLRGKTSVEIIREVLRDDHDLVMRVAKGQNSARRGFFGNTGMRLLRKCPCAVWLVAPISRQKAKHVLACIDTSTDDPRDIELNDKIFELASSISEYRSGKFSVLHAWSIFGEHMVKGRMKPEEFAAMQRDSRNQVEGLFDDFLRKHGSSAKADNVHLLKGDVPVIVSEFVRDSAVGLVVMGTIARSGVAGLLIGNTAEQILDRIECSVLALKPADFESPIKL